MIVQVRANLKTMCLSVYGVKLWNTLPEDITNGTTVNIFKKCLNNISCHTISLHYIVINQLFNDPDFAVVDFRQYSLALVDGLIPIQLSAGHVMYVVLSVTDRLAHVEIVTVVSVLQPDPIVRVATARTVGCPCCQT